MRKWMMAMALAALVPLAGCGAGEAPAQETDGDDARAAMAANDGKGDRDGGRDDDRDGDASRAAGADACTVAQALRPLPDALVESSGVAASRVRPGVFWTHNDSGDPELFAVDADGRLAGRVRVSGATVEDWEDVSAAPCPGGGDCLYVADIGDNDADRASVTVWRVAEPAAGAAETRPAEALRLRYPDGPHDAEAMFVLGGRVHLLTKGETGPIALYRAPASTAPGAEATLEKVRELSPGEVGRSRRITSADASPDGAWIAVRTLDEAAFYPSRALLEGGAAEPRRMDLRSLGESQGEGIGFTPDGAVVLTSEGKKKEPGTFARLTCSL